MALVNPFPGLRPFEADEEHLFFGREKETDELLRRLRLGRFVAVLGASGSGKSSLVRSGLIPALQGGFMAGAGSSWRIAVMRPGHDPIGHLAAALAAPDVLPPAAEDLASTAPVLVEAALRRGPRGLVDAVRQARLPDGNNVLVIVDQFEELFRFRQNRDIANSRDEAIAFVRLLLEAAGQQDVPVYVVLTMRSDFIGDCMNLPGLSEAVNAGMYLVGRMSRDAIRLAITGPVAVGGGTIAPRLVNRILNDLGDDQDQLPIVQHALMRTWDRWAAVSAAERPMDLEDYEAIGTLRDALSKHAEEAFAEVEAEGRGALASQVFKALTDTVTDDRGVRRPTSVAELSAIAASPEADVMAVVEAFRRPGRSFLMPPPAVPLTSRSVVDLSHESLMRGWTRLMQWAEEERAAAEFYVRLARAAAWHELGKGGLWRNPELELAQTWRVSAQPTGAWAERYHEGFDRAIAFLDSSVEARRDEDARLARERLARLRRAQWTAVVLGGFFLLASALAYLAWRESGRAERNFNAARRAVDESLASVDRDPAQVGADAPQVNELRRELLGKAQAFYTTFLRQEPSSDALKFDAAMAHMKMGHINRLLGKPADAEREYGAAVDRLQRLSSGSPGRAEYRAALGDAQNWLGETLRPQPSRAADARRAYDRAICVQQALVNAAPSNVAAARALARSHYNRGILSWTEQRAADAEADFRAAIVLLEPVATSDPGAGQELARAYNNLGSLLAMTGGHDADARALWEKAIAIDEGLVRAHPDNRDYKLELATYCANLVPVLLDARDTAAADARSGESLSLLQDLARLSPSLTVMLADAHDLRGVALQATDALAAAREFGVALDRFAAAATDPDVTKLSDYHERFGDLIVNLETSSRRAGADVTDHAMLTRAVETYAGVADRVASGTSRDARRASLETIARVLPGVPEQDRPLLEAASRRLSQTLGGVR